MSGSVMIYALPYEITANFVCAAAGVNTTTELGEQDQAVLSKHLGQIVVVELDELQNQRVRAANIYPAFTAENI